MWSIGIELVQWIFFKYVKHTVVSTFSAFDQVPVNETGVKKQMGMVDTFDPIWEQTNQSTTLLSRDRFQIQ